MGSCPKQTHITFKVRSSWKEMKTLGLWFLNHGLNYIITQHHCCWIYWWDWYSKTSYIVFYLYAGLHHLFFFSSLCKNDIRQRRRKMKWWRAVPGAAFGSVRHALWKILSWADMLWRSAKRIWRERQGNASRGGVGRRHAESNDWGF